MISLGGTPLILEDPKGINSQQVYEWVEKNINPESYTPWLRRSFPGKGYTALTIPTGYRQERPFRINRFYWPCWGASRWAYGHFLADAGQTDAIRKKAFGDAGDQTDKIQLMIESPGGFSEETLLTDVYLLPPTPLSSVPIDTENHLVNNLFLLTVVDERFYWWHEATPLVEFTDTTTWASAFDIAKEALGIDITLDTISSAYLNASPQLNLSYEVVPPWLDALCYNVGHRFVARLDGTYRTERYSTALATRNSDISANPSRRILAGGSRFKDTII